MTEERVKNFFEYFRTQLKRVESIGEREYKIHKKILYVSMIDTIAGLIYPTLSNRKRFTSLLINFASWKEVEYISLPHLVQTLKLNPAPEFDKLREFAYKEYDKWPTCGPLFLDKDIPVTNVGTHWPKSKEFNEAVEEVFLDSLTHAHLLYKFRNALIHNFIPLGSDFEMPEDRQPFYMTTQDLTMQDEEKFYWNLIYPALFFKDITNNIFKNAESHCLKNRIDPIQVLKTGRYWLKSLNQ